MAGLLEGYGTLASWDIEAPRMPDGWNPDGVLGGVNLGAAGADIDAWADGTHILSPDRSRNSVLSSLDATHQDLNHPTTGWMQLPRPEELESGEHGSGYYTYGTDDTGQAGTAARGQWGRPQAMEVIGSVADRLATGNAYTPFGVGNISLRGGQPFPPHDWHQDGRGIDVRPARVDGAQQPISYQDRGYDRAATQRLVDAFRATGQVDKIYFNDPMIRGVQPSKGHDNHFHVQLKR
ncbi:MAG TPA: hypothetical protein VJM79_05585 [Rhizorhapis sp.]|nr:hypothetical protein [Rhizorhapis sp.]